LAHPVGAGYLFAVAVLGEKRLRHIWLGNIIGKYRIYCLGNACVNISPRHIFLVVGGGTGDGKLISSVAVPFRVDAVQGDGLDGKDIGKQGCLRPCGIDFTGGNIFDVIFVLDVIVCGRGVRRRAIMDDYVFGGWCTNTFLRKEYNVWRLFVFFGLE
jgi:hypothetical protein